MAEKVRETVEAVTSLQAINPLGGELTYQQLADQLGLDKSAARRRVKVAIEKGFLVNQETRKGLPARITLGDPLPDQKSVLPEPTAINYDPSETVATVPPQGDSPVKPSSSVWQDQKPPACHPGITKDFLKRWQVAKGKKMAVTTVKPTLLFTKDWMVARWHESARKAH